MYADLDIILFEGAQVYNYANVIKLLNAWHLCTWFKSIARAAEASTIEE
ncbi:hypothetical protein SPBRAN_1146 [uncultured Candidatus Thioglobus sp.]|nr:hypothetical protein SPBRAN_1146 [uncultured Candidatus Thioglobus sp.]